MSDGTSGSRIDEFVKGLNPAFFSIVMATGIVAMAVYWHGRVEIALGLTVLNMAVFAVLLVLTLARLARHPGQIGRDASDPQKAFGLFTTVAGANVLGVQVLIVLKAPAIAAWLWGFGVVLWVVLTYSVLACVVSVLDKPKWTDTLSGTWLLLVVATQSCAVTGIQIFPSNPNVCLLALFWFLSGCFLYLILITLIYFRLTLFNLQRRDMTPPYWINMGALSISTLAGAKLLASPEIQVAPFASLVPFIFGLTVALWCFASWWIPLLVVLGAWRHGPAGVPMTYNVGLWAMVFPLGMYSVCTHSVAGLLAFPLVESISAAFAAIASVTWAVCLVGLGLHAWRECRSPKVQAA